MKLLCLCYVWLLALLPSHYCKAEVFTATSALQSTFSLEREVVELLRDYMDHVEEGLNKMRRYLEEYNEVERDIYHLEEQGHPDEPIAGNALHAFHLMKRFVVDWSNLDQFMRKASWLDVSQRVEWRRQQQPVPKESDLIGVAKSLILLHDTYRMDLKQLARGDILGVPTTAKLTARDCTYMGHHSYRLGQLSNAVEWLDVALGLTVLERNRTISTAEVLQHAQMARLAHDQAASRANVTSAYILPEPLNGRSAAEVRRRNERRAPARFQLGLNLTLEQDFANYQALCRGEQLLPAEEISKLQCYFSDRKNPYLKLMPIKVEEKHRNPDLYLFHDVISETEIIMLRHLSTGELHRSRTMDKLGVTDNRVSRTAWMRDNVHPVVAALSRKVSAITGFRTHDSGAEPFQVVNYGVGGHYSFHTDFFTQQWDDIERKDEYLHRGDRIATLMFYLSDVIRGGATAFPKLGVAIFPERGAAAFWHNLKANGRGDARTLHGGCPVAYGSKWIANKWIRERDQIQIRPCRLDPRL